ncbi:MAG: ferrous iron transporter B [Acidobacteriota bacterium]|nr:ferrous iron transporter B [Blastocatellia bacterium]MDW8167328.1 ferrous iron transporter B [Acidobacteriota bacterium]MDW8257346.1 ferrous iron transporter B [Acidobacteriota bacterium]
MSPLSQRKKIVLVGNPNVGKSALFRHLTGRYALVSNYPGTTVEISRGRLISDGIEYEVIDTPGITSLVPQSEDERVACEVLLREQPDVIVQVADAKNLRRTLLLTLQLVELRRPMVLVLNMVDEMRERGIEINADALAELFGIPVVETIATYGYGLRQLLRAIPRATVPKNPLHERQREVLGMPLEDADLPVGLIIEWMEVGDARFQRQVEQLLGRSRLSPVRQVLGPSPASRGCQGCSTTRSLCRELERARAQFLEQAVLTLRKEGRKQPRRELAPSAFRWWMGLLLCGVGLLIWEELGGRFSWPTPTAWLTHLLLQYVAEPTQAFFHAHRLDLVHHFLFGRPSEPEYGVLVEATRVLTLFTPILIPAFVLMRRSARFLHHLGRWTRQPLTGIPILMVILILVYELVGYTGAQTLVGALEEILFGAYLIPWLQSLIPSGFFHELLVGPYGLISMGLTYALAIILPVVVTFFLAFGVLEDSGYLPRLAILSDRVLRLMGLNGKAILPMVLGLGCDTMATMTTRILNSPRERLIATLLLALGVPCSAQLGVILGIAAAYSPVVILTVLGVVASQLVLVGHLAAKVIPGQRSDFIFELPPLRIPILRNILLKTWLRLRWFLGEVVPIFLLATLALFLLDQIRFGARTGIEWIEHGLRPLVVGWLGLPAEAARAFVMGFLRRDYGAAGLFDLARHDGLTTTQVIVALVTITLFVPCLANFLVIVREQGVRRALAIVGFIIPFAFAIGGIVGRFLRALGAFS